MLSTLFNQIKLVYGPFGQSRHAQYTLFLPQTSQEGRKRMYQKREAKIELTNIPIYCGNAVHLLMQV